MTVRSFYNSNLLQYSDAYRYGFNGMEKDDAIKGEGNSYDFGARIYDPRLGRWLALDVESKNYPQFSPYVFALNVPTMVIDPNGKYGTDANGNIIFVPAGKPEFRQQPGPSIKETVDPATGLKVKTGTGYYAQKGYILADDGTRILVYLVTDKSVYRFRNEEVVSQISPDRYKVGYGRPKVGEKVEGDYNATTNCTGYAMLNGKFVLYSDHVTEEKRSVENYEAVTGTSQAGDVGVYIDENGVIVHAEKYEADGTVSEKGGYEMKTTGNKPETSWGKNKYSTYVVLGKGTPNSVVDMDPVEKKDDVRTVSKKEFKAAQKKLKAAAKKKIKNLKIYSFSLELFSYFFEVEMLKV